MATQLYHTRREISSLENSGTGIPGTRTYIGKLGKLHSVRGMVDTITSHDASSGGNVVNRSLFEYNDSGHLTKEYQKHYDATNGRLVHTTYEPDKL